jgi:hypothetical protein
VVSVRTDGFFNTATPNFVHTVYLFIIYDSHKKRLLFPDTTFADLSSSWKLIVFHVSYKQNLYVRVRSMFI